MSDSTQPTTTPDVEILPSDTAQVLNHSYDGIQEFDNPLPGWWKALFLASVLWAGAYLFFFNGEWFSVAREYETEHAELLERAASANLLEGISNESLEDLAKDATAVELAKAKYLQVCASCHGDLGQGKIGPNLTDTTWIHVEQPTDIYLTIFRGVEAKGMIAWGKSLKPEEIQRLTAFVLTLRGTSPANPRAPEGDKTY